MEGDDANEPISDTVRGIIDGHIMLSRKVATSNRYPAIDILSSISRLMNEIVLPEHKEAAGRLRKMLSVYESNLDLVSIGASAFSLRLTVIALLELLVILLTTGVAGIVKATFFTEL